MRVATLQGVCFRQNDNVITIVREARAVAHAKSRPGQLWDSRWRVTAPDGAEVRALGPALRKVPGWRDIGLPRQMLEVTPGVWQGDSLIAAPVAGWPQGYTAEIAVPLHAFIKAH
jgi:tRNA(Ile)-lysidine synthase